MKSATFPIPNLAGFPGSATKTTSLSFVTIGTLVALASFTSATLMSAGFVTAAAAGFGVAAAGAAAAGFGVAAAGAAAGATVTEKKFEKKLVKNKIIFFKSK